MHVFKTSFNKLSVDHRFRIKAGRVFCWTFQNRDYHKRRVVECEIAEWRSVNNSATEKTLTVKSLAFFSYPVCENKMSSTRLSSNATTLGDKCAEVLRDTKQQ